MLTTGGFRDGVREPDEAGVIPGLFHQLFFGGDQSQSPDVGERDKAAVVDGHPVTKGEIDRAGQKRPFGVVKRDPHVEDGSEREFHVFGVEAGVESQSVGKFKEKEVRSLESALAG